MDDNVNDCSGCGACCIEQRSPPGYLSFAKNGAPDPDDEDAIADWNIFQTIPDDARAIIDDYLAWDMKNHPTGESCIWFNWRTRKCSYYEYRPMACREFQVNSDDCKAWHKIYKIN